MAITITEENFIDEVMKSNKTVLVDFWAEWCSPCRRLSPIIDEIAEENPDIKVVKINVDEEPVLAEKFEIMSIPSLFIIKNGEIKSNLIGVRPKEEILGSINEE